MITPHSSDGESDHGFQIAPMVDVVFVLLLFFMALAGMRQVEHGIEQKLPVSGGSSHEIPLVIDIGAAGTVRCNGLELVTAGEHDISKLRAWLRNIGEVEGQTPVVIRPEPDSEHARFIDVRSSLKAAGLNTIAFR